MPGQFIHYEFDDRCFITRFERRRRRRVVAIEQIDERCVRLGAHRSIETYRRATLLPTEIVTALVRGDGVEPRLEAAFLVEVVGRQMHLQKCFLEDVVGAGAVSNQSRQEAVQLILVAVDQDAKCAGIACAMRHDQLFVRALVAGCRVRGGVGGGLRR